eukprot:gene11214-biopygen9020
MTTVIVAPLVVAAAGISAKRIASARWFRDDCVGSLVRCAHQRIRRWGKVDVPFVIGTVVGMHGCDPLIETTCIGKDKPCTFYFVEACNPYMPLLDSTAVTIFAMVVAAATATIGPGTLDDILLFVSRRRRVSAQSPALPVPLAAAEVPNLLDLLNRFPRR